ncbi:hypothetical protein TNCV_4197231 [Trichonephila clavipes]|nr:hypothetical protein TNCV_4197231 [Trichonephila clavipes]
MASLQDQSQVVEHGLSNTNVQHMYRANLGLSINEVHLQDPQLKSGLKDMTIAILFGHLVFLSVRGLTQTGPINHCTYRISSPWQHHLQSNSLQHSHISAFGAAIPGNSSGTRYLEVPLGDFPFLPQPLQLRFGAPSWILQSQSDFGPPPSPSTRNEGDARILVTPLSSTAFPNSNLQPYVTLVTMKFECNINVEIISI